MTGSSGVLAALARFQAVLAFIAFSWLSAVSAQAAWQIVTVGPASATGQYTSLRLKTGNVPVISYYQLSSADLMLATCTANCGTASPTWQVVEVDSFGVVGQNLSLALNGAGNPIISYYDFTNGDLKMATCTANCSGATPTWQIVVVDSANNVGDYTSIQLDGSDRPVISYYDVTAGNLKLATCTANCTSASPTWQIVTVDNSASNVGQYTSLRINASNRPLISYYDATAAKLKLATCTANCTTASPTWQIVTVSDAATDVGKDSSLMLTLFGNPVISYYADFPDRDLKLATCTANCATASPTWQIVTVDSTGFVGSDTSLALTVSASPVISYYAAGLGLRLATCLADCQGASPIWQIEELDSTAGLYTSLQLASTGDPLVSGLPIISYTSNTNAVNLVTVTSLSTFTVTASPNPANGGGVLNCAPTSGGAPAVTAIVTSGGTGTCTATPDSGFSTQSISGCGGTATGTGVNSYVTGPIGADCTVTATFLATGPVNGSCGTADGFPSQSPPASNLCNVGTPSGVTTNPSDYAWTCAGLNGGTNASCAAPRLFAVNGSAGAGGSISCTSPVVAGETTTCTASPSVGFATQSMSGCGGSATGQGVNLFTTGAITANCVVSATFVAVPVVNGTCGAAHNSFSLVPPSTDLCASGTATPVSTLASSYTWSCSGSGGGTNSPCQAIREWSVTASAGPGGSLVCDPTRTSVLSGFCTATPDSGFATQSISGCGGTPTGLNVNLYGVETGTSDCTVTATFVVVGTPGGPGTPAAPIPAFDKWSLYAAVVLLLGAGAWRLRRRGLRD